MKHPLDPARTALVMVDLQGDFLHPEGAYGRGGCHCPGASEIAPRLEPVARTLKAKGGYVAACRFTLWPDAKGEPIVSPHLLALRPFLRRGDFQRGAPMHEVVEPLRGHVDVAVDKVAYSAFYNTQLDWVLQRAGIDTVVVCGLVTNGGVASTARDAHMRDYRVVVLSDASAAFKAESHAAALADLATVGDVVTCQALLAAW